MAFDSGNGPSGGSDITETKLKLTGYYTSSSFAFKMKTDELFSKDMVEQMRMYMGTISQVDPRVFWLPTEVVTPSFIEANMVCFAQFQQCYMEKLMPITMCISEALCEWLNEVYEDDEDVYKRSKRVVQSVTSHTSDVSVWKRWSGSQGASRRTE